MAAVMDSEWRHTDTGSIAYSEYLSVLLAKPLFCSLDGY